MWRGNMAGLGINAEKRFNPDDGLIPANDSERIWQARYGTGERDPATYYLVAGANHTQGFNTNKAVYLAKVGDFFAQHLK